MRPDAQIPGVVTLGSDFKALGVIRSLGRRGIPGVVVDNEPRSAWFSRYVTRRVLWRDAMDSPDFADFLLEIGRTHGLRDWMLVATQDDAVETVARSRDALATLYRPTTPGWEVVRWAFDKRLTHEMARAVGVAFPATWYPADEGELARLDLRFPVIIKPAISIRMQRAARLKALPAADLDELRARYRTVAAMVSPDEIMVQEIIPGALHYSVAAFCVEGDARLVMTAQRRRQYPIDYGLGSSFVEAVALPELIEPARRLLAQMRACGMVEVEFKRDPRDGSDKLLDINIRPWGWHTLCIACGLDLPYIQYRHLLGETPTRVEPRYGVRWLRMATDLPAGLQEARAGVSTPWNYLRSLVGRNAYSVLDWRDPLPTAGDLVTLVGRTARSHSSKPAQAKEALA